MRLVLPRVSVVVTFVCFCCQKTVRASKTPGPVFGRQHICGFRGMASGTIELTGGSQSGYCDKCKGKQSGRKKKFFASAHGSG